jgi:hypothetical protein
MLPEKELKTRLMYFDLMLLSNKIYGWKIASMFIIIRIFADYYKHDCNKLIWKNLWKMNRKIKLEKR